MQGNTKGLIEVATKINDEGNLEQRTDIGGEILSKRVLAIQNAQVQQALVALGWTPPPSEIHNRAQSRGAVPLARRLGDTASMRTVFPAWLTKDLQEAADRLDKLESLLTRCRNNLRDPVDDRALLDDIDSYRGRGNEG